MCHGTYKHYQKGLGEKKNFKSKLVKKGLFLTQYSGREEALERMKNCPCSLKEPFPFSQTK